MAVNGSCCSDKQIVAAELSEINRNISPSKKLLEEEPDAIRHDSLSDIELDYDKEELKYNNKPIKNDYDKLDSLVDELIDCSYSRYMAEENELRKGKMAAKMLAVNTLSKTIKTYLTLDKELAQSNGDAFDEEE